MDQNNQLRYARLALGSVLLCVLIVISFSDQKTFLSFAGLVAVVACICTLPESSPFSAPSHPRINAVFRALLILTTVAILTFAGVRCGLNDYDTRRWYRAALVEWDSYLRAALLCLGGLLFALSCTFLVKNNRTRPYAWAGVIIGLTSVGLFWIAEPMKWK